MITILQNGLIHDAVHEAPFVGDLLIDNGKTASELANIYKISEYPARKTMDSARRFSPGFCKKASELILETDYRMKTSFDEQERLLEMLLLQLAGEN